MGVDVDSGWVKPPFDIDNRKKMPRTATGIVDLDPEWLNVDAQKFQFKSGGDEFGVNERLQGVTHFDSKLCGIVLVWQNLAGELFIGDGHQRMGLARRARANGQAGEAIYLPARVFKEADGYSVNDVKLIAAYKNIAEGTGTAIDAANVIRLHGDLPSTIPGRSELVRQARLLSRLSDTVFGAVCNDFLTPEFGAIIAQVLDPLTLEDAARAKLEMAIFKAFVDPDTRPANVDEAVFIGREVVRTGIHQDEDTPSLFGFEETDNILKERAEILATAKNMLGANIADMRMLTAKQPVIQRYMTGASTVNTEKAKKDLASHLVAQKILESGWMTSEFGGMLTSVARKFHERKKRLDQPEVQTLIAGLDTNISDCARALKSAKAKGETDARIAKLRVSFAREFLAKVETFVSETDVGRALCRSLGHEAQAAGPGEVGHDEGPGLF